METLPMDAGVIAIKMGGRELYSLTDGNLALDGGAMFGVVPRPLWSRALPPDDRNRIPMALNPLLFKGSSGWILVDSGIDDKRGEKHCDIYAVDRRPNVEDGLKLVGVTPEDISVVINTHLHWDHAGGNTVQRNGKLVPAFPNARYVVQQQDLHDALHPHERNRASYFAENYEPLIDLGLFETVNGVTELETGVRLIPLPGHTAGMQGVEVETEEGLFVFVADLIPTAAHAPLAWIMAYDLEPLRTLEVRKEYYPRWAEARALISPGHDRRVRAGRLFLGDKGWSMDPIITT